jgi:nucleoside 2-deoxyribosyltransferase
MENRGLAMSDQQSNCPICKLEAQNVIKEFDAGERVTINCARCKRFTITRTAERIAEKRSLGYKLSAWIRELNENSKDVPEINSKTLDTLEKELPNYGPSEKQLKLLRAIEKASKYPGDHVDLHRYFDFPLAWASCDDELLYYILALNERKLVRPPLGTTVTLGNISFTLEITAEGWKFLEEQRNTVSTSHQAFIAMSFSDDMTSAWESAIRPAVLDEGYKPYRIDTEPHLERIDVKIMSEIQNSRFLVADVTNQKQGVYFEAGYALGLKMPVIWTCKKTDIKNAHFDTRQYNHILWTNEKDFKEQLFYFITVLIGKP